jgi:hypothetical protein
MFEVDLDYRPATAEDCAALADPIRRYLAGPDADRPVERIWFSVPESLDWEHRGQHVVVDGGLVAGGQLMRFRAEVHFSFCNCGCCRFEDAYSHMCALI